MLLMNYELTMNYVSPSGEWINKCAIGGSAAAKYRNRLDGSAASAFFHGLHVMWWTLAVRWLQFNMPVNGDQFIMFHMKVLSDLRKTHKHTHIRLASQCLFSFFFAVSLSVSLSSDTPTDTPPRGVVMFSVNKFYHYSTQLNSTSIYGRRW